MATSVTRSEAGNQEAAQRAGHLREGLKRVSRVIIFALVMDAIYQFLVLRWFYPGEALVTAFVVAVLPYLLIRGPAARIARRLNRRGAAYQGTVSTDAGGAKKAIFLTWCSARDSGNRI